MRSRSTSLISPVVAVILGGAACTGSAAGPAADTAAPPGAAAATQQVTGYAPYVDATAASATDTAGDPDTYNLAFVLAEDGSCAPAWHGTTALDSAAVTARLAALRQAGGALRVSFGGAAGTELARACGTVDELTAAYQRVVDATGAKALDFDIEGDALADTAATERRNRAIAALEAADPELEVTYTLPVMPEAGLGAESLALLTNTQTLGVAVHHVNIMAMNYGETYDGDMSDYAEQSARMAHDQIAEILGQSINQAWRTLAVTVMIGDNEVDNETFTLEDAAQVREFARQNGIAWLSIWAAERDTPCTATAKTATGAPTDCSGVDQTAGDFGEALGAQPTAGPPAASQPPPAAG